MSIEPFDVVDLIRTKRDKGALTTEQITWMIDAYTRGYVADEQMSAMTMAIFLNGMTREEVRDMTLAMVATGTRLDFSSLSKKTTDKHSTGGVGDKISLHLAPMVAACGVVVPMISGRGLGHTGGTLDKLDAIPGYATQPGLDLFRKATREAGCAIIGQTADLAPADKRLYGIRDVTATVESVPLITASILSKKLAAGLGHLVLDVKMGSGAFMTRMADAEELAAEAHVRAVPDATSRADQPEDDASGTYVVTWSAGSSCPRPASTPATAPSTISAAGSCSSGRIFCRLTFTL